MDLSNKVLAAKIVEGSQDITALKAKEPFDFITTMSCLKANGAMHTYLIQFEEYPKQLVIEEGSSNRSVASDNSKSPDSGNFSETSYPTSSNLPANASVLEQAFSMSVSHCEDEYKKRPGKMIFWPVSGYLPSLLPPPSW